LQRDSPRSDAAAGSGYELLTDEELIWLAKTDKEAFAMLYRRHLPGILAYFKRATHSPEFAFDLAAETFASALLALPRYERGNAAGAGWLYTIARSRLIDSIRRGKSEASARQRLEMEPIVLNDQGAEVVRRLIEEGERAAVRDLVDGLPSDQREAVLARFMNEQEYAEIAAELQCSEQVVRKRVSRALKTLRIKLNTTDA
jgi:RNA polymerase sigma factor (sigma-70 family)